MGKGGDQYAEEKKKEAKERKKETPERPKFTGHPESTPALFTSSSQKKEKKESHVRPYTYRPNELPTFNLDEEEDDVWNDFDDDIHPL